MRSSVGFLDWFYVAVNEQACELMSCLYAADIVGGNKLRIKEGNVLPKSDGLIVLWKPSQNEEN